MSLRTFLSFHLPSLPTTSETRLIPFPSSYSILNSSLISNLPSIKGDLSDVLSTASELANSRASKIIGVRNEQHAALQLGQFLEMFSEAWSFVVACEVICRKMIVGLRGTMVVQVRFLFVRSFLSVADGSHLPLRPG